ncbi:MAG: deoxyribodipyrimidine photolyase [Chitinivibrionales bacterium]|nr:deoxyribodipyrimidine photolyase [Chitinivibrionales bacterium]MBD3357270.1 deoxyribodipyrimidine photolyase [Chitinivibrionales bacterium]
MLVKKNVDGGRRRSLNGNPDRRGNYILYWMQQSQREAWNDALEYAVAEANSRKKPILVAFALTESFPEANARHYVFMLEGLVGVEEALAKRGVGMVVRLGDPRVEIPKLARDAALLICDKGYLRVQRQWRTAVAANVNCPMVEVEGDVVIPVDSASAKEEFSAATLRRKIQPLVSDYLKPLYRIKPKSDSLGIKLDSFDIGRPRVLVSKLKIDQSVPPVNWLRGGTAQARRKLKYFIARRLDRFDELRNDPSHNYQSQLSPYLHFGQISPREVALAVAGTESPGKNAFLEELIVRRELAINFVYHNEHYDRYEGIPEWARQTLAAHARDKRAAHYSARELEEARTHDPYWNAAQTEMVVRGKMHGYMRMYWGKKILEWSKTPQEAFSTALFLDNKYFLDGRDPNGYTGVAWCFGKHDHPWTERKVFGKVRYMNDKGLRRKFDMDGYLAKVNTWKDETTTLEAVR